MMDDPWWCFSFSQDRASSENQFVLTALVLVCIMERSYSTRLNFRNRDEQSNPAQA